MPNDVVTAILAGIGGMLGWGIGDFIAKKTIDAVGDVVSLAWAHIFGTIVLLALLGASSAYGHSIVWPATLAAWLPLMFFGTLQALIYFLVYRGFGKGQVAVLNPVFASFAGITAILSLVIFKESVTGQLLLALGVLFSGVLLVSADFKALRAQHFRLAAVPGFKEVALATGLAACWTLGWDRIVNGQDWLVYATVMYASMTVAILIVAGVRRVPLRVRRRDIWPYLAGIGVCETVAYTAISWGYGATTRTSIVALVSGAFSIPTIVLARLVLKERVTTTQTVGSVAVIVGIALLALR